MALTAENRGIRGKYSLDAILDYHVPTKSSDVRLAYEQSRRPDPDGKGRQGGSRQGRIVSAFAN